MLKMMLLMMMVTMTMMSMTIITPGRSTVVIDPCQAQQGHHGARDDGHGHHNDCIVVDDAIWALN